MLPETLTIVLDLAAQRLEAEAKAVAAERALKEAREERARLEEELKAARKQLKTAREQAEEADRENAQLNYRLKHGYVKRVVAENPGWVIRHLPEEACRTVQGDCLRWNPRPPHLDCTHCGNRVWIKGERLEEE